MAVGARRSIVVVGVMVLTSFASAGLGLPKVVDWDKKGKVPEQYDLTECFTGPEVAVAIALSSYIAIKEERPPLKFSVQQLIDCADGCGCGCNLTAISSDLHYATHTALVNNTAYPQIEHSQPCQKQKLHHPVARVTGYSHHTHISEEQLMGEVIKGPVAAEVEAASFQFYQGGVYNGNRCLKKTVDDIIVVVGYNDEAPVPYWKLLINFGTEFGMNGYLFLEKTKENLCSLYTNVTRVEGVTVGRQ